MNDTLPFRLAAGYDRMRLATYREHGSRSSRITIGSSGKSLLLRFDDVGYFNAVYGNDEDLVDRLDVLEDFFSGSPHGCRLITPTLSSASPLASACAVRGWVPDLEFAWLTADPVPRSSSPPGRFEIRSPGCNEQELFFRTYLMAFDAGSDRIPAAIANMRHLFSNPHLHFLFACENDRPVGVGMLYQSGHSALLCAERCSPPLAVRADTSCYWRREFNSRDRLDVPTSIRGQSAGDTVTRTSSKLAFERSARPSRFGCHRRG